MAYNPEKYNPESRRKSYLKHKEKNIEYSTWYNRKRKLGITKEEYLNLLEKQNGVCAICNQTCTKSLAVDHDHTTSKIRGLLCNSCNRGLGYLKDSIAILKAATTYLEYYKP